MVYGYIEWRNDSVIVTDQRIIRITRTIATFRTNISEIAVSSIHEANTEIPANDPFARLFNYGTVVMKTAGSVGNLYFDFMPHPLALQQLIIEDSRLFKERQAQQHRNAMRAELDKWLTGNTGEASTRKTNDGPPRRLSSSLLQTKIQFDNGDTIYRHHLIVWFQHIFAPGLLLLASFVGMVITAVLGIWLGTALAFFVFLVSAVAFYLADWDWRNDYFVVNDNTITIVHRRPLWLQNEHDQILLERVDNVVSESSGFLPTLLGYGDLSVSLLGADEHKEFKMIAKPQEVQENISRRLARMEKQQQEADAKQQREIIGEYLSLYDQVRQQGEQLPQTYDSPNPAQPYPQQPTAPYPPPNYSPPNTPNPQYNPAPTQPPTTPSTTVTNSGSESSTECAASPFAKSAGTLTVTRTTLSTSATRAPHKSSAACATTATPRLTKSVGYQFHNYAMNVKMDIVH